MTNPDLEITSTPIMEKVLQAHTDKDYALFTRLFNQEYAKQIPTEAQFNEAVDNAVLPLGEPSAMTYLGSVFKQRDKLVVWKTAFTPGKDELLWHLYLSDDNQLNALWFG